MATPLPPLPNVFWDLPAADSVAYGDDPKGRGALRPFNGTYDVDPEPLAMLLTSAVLQSSDLMARVRDVATDDLDGPIHLVRLLVACHHAAQRTHGYVSRSGAVDDLVRAFGSGGLPAATRLARTLDQDTRADALQWLVSQWQAPIIPLYDGKT
jgi:hypothetical protein